MPRRGNGKAIYLDEVAELLRAGVTLPELCERLGVREASVTRAYLRAARAGLPTPGYDIVRRERQRTWQERQDAHNRARRERARGLRTAMLLLLMPLLGGCEWKSPFDNDGYGGGWSTRAAAWCLMLAGVLGIGLMVRRYRPARPAFGFAVLLVVASVVLPALTGCATGRSPGVIPRRDGTYTIGATGFDDVMPGTYRTYSNTCRWKVAGDWTRSGSGPGTVHLDGDHDTKITVRGCGTWREVNK